MLKIEKTKEQLAEDRIKLAKVLKSVERPLPFNQIDLIVKNCIEITFYAGYVEYSLTRGHSFRTNRKTGEPVNKSEAFNLELEAIKQYNTNFRTKISK